MIELDYNDYIFLKAHINLSIHTWLIIVSVGRQRKKGLAYHVAVMKKLLPK